MCFAFKDVEEGDVCPPEAEEQEEVEEIEQEDTAQQCTDGVI
jgi:hypothetical protein